MRMRLRVLAVTAGHRRFQNERASIPNAKKFVCPPCLPPSGASGPGFVTYKTRQIQTPLLQRYHNSQLFQPSSIISFTDPGEGERVLSIRGDTNGKGGYKYKEVVDLDKVWRFDVMVRLFTGVSPSFMTRN
jgi:hypothetical protein